MNLTKKLLDAADEYCRLTGYARSTVALKVMDDGKFFDRVEEGGGVTISTYEKVMKWFADHSEDSRVRNKSNNHTGTKQKTGNRPSKTKLRRGEGESRRADNL